MTMTGDGRQALRQVLDFCNQKWTEADQASAGTWPTPDMLTDRKQAYNEFFQYVRTLLDEVKAS